MKLSPPPYEDMCPVMTPTIPYGRLVVWMNCTRHPSCPHQIAGSFNERRHLRAQRLEGDSVKLIHVEGKAVWEELWRYKNRDRVKQGVPDSIPFERPRMWSGVTIEFTRSKVPFKAEKAWLIY